jgi:hypothetical protein
MVVMMMMLMRVIVIVSVHLGVKRERVEQGLLVPVDKRERI